MKQKKGLKRRNMPLARFTSVIVTLSMVLSLVPTEAVAEMRSELEVLNEPSIEVTDLDQDLDVVSSDEIESGGGASRQDNDQAEALQLQDEAAAPAETVDLVEPGQNGDDAIELVDAMGENPEPNDTARTSEEPSEAATNQTAFQFESNDIKVTAKLDDSAALPKGTRLVVTPLTSKTKGYNYDAYMEALNNDANEQDKFTNKNTLLYDVAFLATGEDGKDVEVQPAEGSVRVNFEFKKNQLVKKLDAPKAEDVTVTHLPLTAEAQEAVDTTAQAKNIKPEDVTVDALEDKDVTAKGTKAIQITTDSFSVYAFSYTVDFHYEGVDYSIPGESQILLSDLIEKLQIKNGDELLKVADVEKVQFTDEHLVEVAEVSGVITITSRGNEKKDVDAGDKNFLLSSKDPFTSNETLTITLTNGETIEVGVTDEQTYDDNIYTYALNETEKTATITGLSASYSGNYNLVIPNEVKVDETSYTINAIDDSAFEYKDAITSVSLMSPTGIAIGKNAFDGCSNMTGTLNGVTSIGDHAFRNTKISSVTMLGVQNIGTQAFDSIPSPIDFTIKGEDLHITHGIVSQSTNFKSITIDARNTLEFDAWSVQGDYNGESKLETITINCLNDIHLPFQVFGDNYNDEFKSITINAHVVGVSGSAFKRLGSSTQPVTVTFKRGVENISENAFGDESKSDEAFHAPSGSRIVIKNNEAQTNYKFSSFPDSNVTIVFNDKEISREPIHDNALNYKQTEDGKLVVTGLYKDESGNTQSNFTVPSTLEWEGASYDVIAIAEGAFKELSNLNVTVEGDIDVRGVYNNDDDCKGAFSNTSNITVTFNGDNTTLGSAAFMKGGGITIVSNGSGTFDIGRKSFFDCKNLDLTVNNGTIPIGVTKGSDGLKGNSFQNTTGELKLLGKISQVAGDPFYAAQVTKVTTIATNGLMLSDIDRGWSDVDIVLQANPDDANITWNAWNKAKSLTVNYADEVNQVLQGTFDLGNNTVPVTINFNDGVDEIYGGAFSDLKGGAGSAINIKGKSATVYEGSFPDDENLTVNFDMYYEDVTGAQYNDALKKTTVTYKAHDYRKEGKEQKLLSDLIESMGLTMEDGSGIDLSKVASVQFQKHDANSTPVAGSILYNVAGETPVNVGSVDYLLTSSTAFTDAEAVCITLNDGTKIKRNWTNQADKYNIDGKDSIKLTDILRATGDSKVFEKLGYSKLFLDNYGVDNHFYFYWRVNDKDGNKLKDGSGYGKPTDSYNSCEITGLDQIEYPGYAKLYIYINMAQRLMIG